MQCRTRAQVAEILSSLNRWYCSIDQGKEVKDPELLARHYIDNHGAEDFDRRFNEAMSPLNRWHCSQYYQREISDPETLWNYYCRYAGGGPGSHTELNSLQSESGIAG